MDKTIFKYQDFSVDFIKNTKLPGVMIAKTMLSKADFDSLLNRDQSLKEDLKNIGYTLRLSEKSEDFLKSIIENEIEDTNKLIEKVKNKAEVFSRVLTTQFRKLSERSKKDTLTLYHLSQIIFIWDEFIDFDDYQKSGGNKDKIRESIFYRAATCAMQEISGDDLENLESMNIETEIFDTALTRLQLLARKITFVPKNYYIILKALRDTGLSEGEAVYFLLNIESFMFIKVSEDLLNNYPKNKENFLHSLKSISEGIEIVKNEFDLNQDRLEDILEIEAEKLIDQVSLDIFNIRKEIYD